MTTFIIYLVCGAFGFVVGCLFSANLPASASQKEHWALPVICTASALITATVMVLLS